jgi:putative ABC transport system ATP-binding protein
MGIISAKSVTKVYQSKKVSLQALQGVDLTVSEGDFLTLVGPSGSGKSTFLNLLGGLDRASGGEIVINNQQLSRLNQFNLAKFRLRNIGFVFQSFNLIPVLTAYENVEIPLILQEVPQKERKRRIHEVLELVGLGELIHRVPPEMSGGQQQRVAIARALVGNPKIILADEPTANLDSKNSLSILELMKSINRKRKTTFIFATHDPEIMSFASRIVKLLDGRIISDESR